MNPPMYGMKPAKSARMASGQREWESQDDHDHPLACRAEEPRWRRSQHVAAEHVDGASARRIERSATIVRHRVA